MNSYLTNKHLIHMLSLVIQLHHINPYSRLYGTKILFRNRY